MYLFSPEVALVESQSMPRTSSKSRNKHIFLKANILWNILEFANANVEIHLGVNAKKFYTMRPLGY